MINENTIEQKCQEFIGTLQRIREEQGLSTDDLAGLTGLKKGNIERIESFVYKPNLETIIRITEALGISLLEK